MRMTTTTTIAVPVPGGEKSMRVFFSQCCTGSLVQHCKQRSGSNLNDDDDADDDYDDDDDADD